MLTDDFLAPGRLWLLLIVMALGAAYVAATFWRRRVALRFTQLELLDEVAPRRPGWRRHIVASLQLLALAAAVIASAQPYQHDTLPPRTYTIQPESAGQIMLAFDVSLSMEAADVTPTRFDAAKEQAKEFVDEVSENVEVGLISFSGLVTTEVQPTSNRDTVKESIDALELGEGTAIGDALAMATGVLTRGAPSSDGGGGDGGGGGGGGGGAPGGDGREGGDEGDAPGVIVLLTDGETTQGRLTTDQGAQVAADANVPVFSIAFGTETGTIEIDDPVQGPMTVPVPYMPQALQTVADTTGGQSFDANTGDELADAYDEIDGLLADTFGEPVEFTGDEITVEIEQTWKWVVAAIVLFASGWILSLWLLRSIL